jgi:hypothetical protein
MYNFRRIYYTAHHSTAATNYLPVTGLAGKKSSGKVTFTVCTKLKDRLSDFGCSFNQCRKGLTE